MRRKKQKPVRFKVGDLVQLSSFWEGRVGIVRADDKVWWVIRGHYDVASCIVSADDVAKVIRRQVVPARYIRKLY